jgi:integrase
MSKHRNHGEGTIYTDKKHLGRFVAQVSLPNGKRKTKRGTQAECRAWLLEQRKAVKDNTYIRNDSVTVANIAERYLKDVAPAAVEESTLNKHRTLIRKHVVPELGTQKISTLRAEHLQSLYSKKLSEGLARRTVIDIHNRIYTILKLAQRWGMVTRNVAEDMTPPTAPKDKVTVLTTQEAKHFLDSTHGERLYAIYAVTLSTGLRRGEVLALQWSDIDFITRRIRVNKQIQYVPGKGLITKAPKTQSAFRDLPMPQVAYDALIEHRANSMGTGLVFATGKGTPFSPRNVLRDFHKALAKAGLPQIPFHNLRHSCASYHLAAGTNPKLVQQLLGHSTVAITLQVYSHLLPRVAEEAISKLDSVFA